MRRQHGFSLLELILYVGLLAGTLAALVALFSTGLETQSLAGARVRLSEAQRLTGALIDTRVSEAAAITTPASGSASTLVVTSTDASQSPVTFSLSGTTLMMRVGAGTAQAVTPSDVRVTSFSVTRLSGSPAAVEVDIGYAADAARATLTVTSKLTLTLPYE